MSQLLPSEQTVRQLDALRSLVKTGRLFLSEPCDCGGQIRHNNGGNYHLEEEIALEVGKVFYRSTSTSEYDSWSKWKEKAFGEAVNLIVDRAARGWIISAL